MYGKVQDHPDDRVIAELASRQYGVLSRRQLVSLGLGEWAIEYRLRSGRLHPLYRGVYAVGHTAISVHAARLAAVLAIGPQTWLSVRSGAAHWGMRMTARTRVEVTTARSVRSRPGIHVHHGALEPDEVTVHDGIPVTSPPRTLLDLAGVVSRHQLERAVNQAEVLRLTGALSLADLVARYPRRPGVPALRAILATADLASPPTRSELEDRFLAFLDDHGLPRPRINTPIAGLVIVPDCQWPAERVVVELDGYRFHGTRAAFESDRARDRTLQAAGYRVIRVTWRQLTSEPAAVASALRAMLDGHRHEPPPLVQHPAAAELGRQPGAREPALVDRVA